MENRDSVLADYFKLRILLNRTNMAPDQKTEIDFLALSTGTSNYSLVATLKGVYNPKHIELCKLNFGSRWDPSTYSGLLHLENFCATFLSKNLSRHFSYDELKEKVAHLKTELQGLGISRQ